MMNETSVQRISKTKVRTAQTETHSFEEKEKKTFIHMCVSVRIK